MDPAEPESQPRLPAGVEERLASYLAGQRWYAGDREPEHVSVVATRELCPVPGHNRALLWAIVEAEGERYQLLIGRRPNGDPADFLAGHDHAYIAGGEDVYYYDAALDPDLCLRLLGVVTSGVEFAARVRPIGVEQSNTSLVYDDRLIVKFYRRLLAGPNPDVQVTNGLARVGFRQVATPVSTWRDHGVDLAFAQQFLAGGTEGWALALTSLRDFYHSDVEDPAEAGGDFSVEARRIGRMTAELHLAMHRAWPQETGRVASAEWETLVATARTALEGAGDQESGLVEIDAKTREAVLARLGAVTDAGPAQRVHGDYHLGQVMRTDGGWYALDFEGEPARPLHERVLPASPLKDVAGMLRSLDYAARAGLRDSSAAGSEIDAKGSAWEAHNRAAFLDGYSSAKGISALLPEESAFDAVLALYELDKAIYELAYERAYRPTWVAVPAGAVARISARLA